MDIYQIYQTVESDDQDDTAADDLIDSTDDISDDDKAWVKDV